MERCPFHGESRSVAPGVLFPRGSGSGRSLRDLARRVVSPIPSFKSWCWLQRLLAPPRLPLGAYAQARLQRTSSWRLLSPNVYYSWRKALLGLILPTLKTGTAMATEPQAASASTARPTIFQSNGPTSYSMPATTCPAPAAPATPAIAPKHNRTIARRQTKACTCQRVAPSAMRTPISWVRVRTM